MQNSGNRVCWMHVRARMHVRMWRALCGCRKGVGKCMRAEAQACRGARASRHTHAQLCTCRECGRALRNTHASACLRVYACVCIPLTERIS